MISSREQRENSVHCRGCGQRWYHAPGCDVERARNAMREQLGERPITHRVRPADCLGPQHLPFTTSEER